MLIDSGGAKMQAKPKRTRCPKWTTEETMILAKYKRQASLQGEVGMKVWKEISSRISCKSDLQCRRRWETLTKVYNHIRDYCLETGQDLKDLSEDELASMELDTAYHPNWYTIVEEVCSQRRRSHSDQLTPAALSTGSITGSVTLSTTTEESITTSPDNQSEINRTNERREESEDVEELVEVRGEPANSRGDEASAQAIVPLPNWDEEPDSLDELTMTLGSEFVVPEYSRQDQRFHEAKDIIFDCFSPPISFPPCFLPDGQVQTVINYDYMSNPLNQGGRYPECEKHYSPSLRSSGDVRFDSPPPPTIARYGLMSRNESSDDLSSFMSKLNLSGAARSSSLRRDTRSDPREDERLSKPRARFSSATLPVHFQSIADDPPRKRIISIDTLMFLNTILAIFIDHIHHLTSRNFPSKQTSKFRLCEVIVIELKVNLCCDKCVRKMTKVLEHTKGVEGPVTCDMNAMKVSVTATAVPEVVLERVRTVRKDADLWPEIKPTAD